MEDDMVRTWQLKDARANFSTLVDKVIGDGPQIVTRHGKKTVIVVSIEEWMSRERRRGDLIDFFANSPLRSEPRDIRSRNSAYNRGQTRRRRAFTGVA
jgi:prevent-host-death family protein